MRDSYVKMVRHLQTKLPLDSVYLHLKCLAPAHLTSDWTVNSIKRLCALIPQVVADKDIPLVLDQWRLLQMEDIPEKWIKKPDGSRIRVDLYYSKIFEIEFDSGDKKYDLLSKLIMSCLSIQNGNADVERSLSDNKNTQTPERTKLGHDTLMGLRRMKEHPRSLKGAHNVNTLSKEMVTAVQGAHQKFLEKKREEESEKQLLAAKEKDKVEQEQVHKAMVESAEKRKKRLDEKEKDLEEDEKAHDELQLAEKLLEKASKSLHDAIDKSDILGIKIANEMVQMAQVKYKEATLHKNEQKNVRCKLGEKSKIHKIGVTYEEE